VDAIADAVAGEAGDLVGSVLCLPGDLAAVSFSRKQEADACSKQCGVWRPFSNWARPTCEFPINQINEVYLKNHLQHFFKKLLINLSLLNSYHFIAKIKRRCNLHRHMT
jgi:hypothetical protein